MDAYFKMSFNFTSGSSDYTIYNVRFKWALKGVSGFDVCLFILKNIRIRCKLEIQVSIVNEQG